MVGTVHHRVGERDADLDGVGTGIGHGPQRGEPPVVHPAGDVGDEQLAARSRAARSVASNGSRRRRTVVSHDRSPRRSATWATSLSPRPDRLTSTT